MFSFSFGGSNFRFKTSTASLLQASVPSRRINPHIGSVCSFPDTNFRLETTKSFESVGSTFTSKANCRDYLFFQMASTGGIMEVSRRTRFPPYKSPLSLIEICLPYTSCKPDFFKFECKNSFKFFRLYLQRRQERRRLLFFSK